MTTEPITLQMALDDPAPLFAVTCRACGAKFEDINGKRLCDICLVERINGAGELELDDPDDVINLLPITCGVHHLPAPSNPRGILLCQDCLDNLDSAAQHIAELRDATIDGWLTWLASQDDATIVWWHKMEALDPPTFAGKCALALEKGGRGAAVVSAWRAKEEALTRCAAAEREIEGARGV